MNAKRNKRSFVDRTIVNDANIEFLRDSIDSKKKIILKSRFYRLSVLSMREVLTGIHDSAKSDDATLGQEKKGCDCHEGKPVGGADALPKSQGPKADKSVNVSGSGSADNNSTSGDDSQTPKQKQVEHDPEGNGDKEPSEPGIKIRSLAIGSPSSEIAAKFQLAYLICLQQEFKVRGQNVSLYDPVFNGMDRHLLTKEYGFVIEESDPYADSAIEEGSARRQRQQRLRAKVIYYLPHIPLEVMESVVEKSRPRCMVGNDVEAHIGKHRFADVARKYPWLARLAMELEGGGGGGGGGQGGVARDGFKAVETGGGRRNRKNRKGRAGVAGRIRQAVEEEARLRLAFREESNTRGLASYVRGMRVRYRFDSKDSAEECGTSFSDMAVIG